MQTNSNFKNNKQRTVRKKQNPLKDAKVVDYLDVKLLQKFTNDQGKILPRRITGVTAYQQRQIAKAIKHARHLALMPFVAQDIA
ncbi:MAG TPA: 30S ribosomal protein S18 [Candidatus Kapabacteria bacterium]|nr:30S ribosomal protein S18 [Candidatus Kapabacteria bacterium]HOM04012.1 30S ribosomal protein S18 [Candidatus Kapabacteria bacterium]HOQ48707.1 30S ribosomal protein S18 [Candidatus Kapabacteria bacterium]HPP38840.1 30S ribosomal protein S18 [Candidatus Kapabacteria bacterium]HPU24396.1 30S ribosomal protein S18 [Candidatus Kapabacteria bacterium]